MRFPQNGWLFCRLYVLNDADETISVIDTTNNIQIDTDPNADGVNPINISGDHIIASGGRLYVVDSSTDTIAVIETAVADPSDNYQLVDMDPSTDGIDSIQLSHSPNFIGQNVAVDDAGTRLYVLNGDGTISVINIDKIDADPSRWSVWRCSPGRGNLP